MPTFDEALRQATLSLAEGGVPEPHLDARMLLCAVEGIDRVALLSRGERPLSATNAARLDAMLRRRLAREPVSRILGRREFWGLDLIVTSDVLDPRPDTETLVEAVLDHAGRDKSRSWRILDLGTGSGAILCALLHELPAARAWGVDRSWAACAVARANLSRCGFGARSLVLHGDWGAAFAPQTFDLVVANPPYVATAVIASLDADVREHDPHAALDGGADGLDAYRIIAAQLPVLLNSGGAAFFELGFDQAQAVRTLLRATGSQPGAIRRDLAGHARVLGATVAC